MPLERVTGGSPKGAKAGVQLKERRGAEAEDPTVLLPLPRQPGRHAATVAPASEPENVDLCSFLSGEV